MHKYNDMTLLYSIDIARPDSQMPNKHKFNM